MTTVRGLGFLVALLIASGVHSVDNDASQRELRLHRVAGYEPLTAVEDFAAIDLDMDAIDRFVDFGLLDSAKAIYEQGGHSQSIAKLVLVNNATPPLIPIPAGTTVVGYSMAGDLIQGTMIEETSWIEGTNDVSLLVQYETTESQTNFCHLGGLAITGAAELEGCFAYGGTVQILDFSQGAPVYIFDYIYEPYLDTFNRMTFQSMSTRLDMLLENDAESSDRPYTKYTKYYDAPDYADQFIQAALNARPTNFLHGNANFSHFGPSSRIQVLPIAAKTLNLWMYIIRMMELALTLCTKPCGVDHGVRCDDLPVRAWDQAFAFYAGSLESEDGNGYGFLLYDLADRMCEKMNTCSESGTSMVNVELVNLFRVGQLGMIRRECNDGYSAMKQIEALMVVPLIQAVLYEAYNADIMLPATDDVSKVKRATYAAAVLPLVHYCNHFDAETIYFSMGLEDVLADTDIDFSRMKETVENNYPCLGVTCRSVGGVWDDSSYGEGASPCNFDDPVESQKSSDLGALLLIVLLALVLAVAILVLGMRYLSRDAIDMSTLEAAQEDVEPPFNHVQQMADETYLTTVSLD